MKNDATAQEALEGNPLPAGASAQPRWLDLRLGLGTRATKDIDLVRTDDEQAATEHLLAAGAIDLGDFLDFDVRRTGGLDAAAGFRGALLDSGRPCPTPLEQFLVDVALGGHRQELVQWLRVPGLLAFAEIEAPELPMVPLERQVAEKLHAYTATYGVREQRSMILASDRHSGGIPRPSAASSRSSV